MIYEVAQLPVRLEQAAAFRQAFEQVAPLLQRAQGYQGHLLAQGVEAPHLFTLIVCWASLEDHVMVFEKGEDHRVFMQVLQDYLVDEPMVHHMSAGDFVRATVPPP